jgi:hypothetical protein
MNKSDRVDSTGVGKGTVKRNIICKCRLFSQNSVQTWQGYVQMAAQACAGNFVAGASLGPTCLVPKAPFKDMDSAIICGW